MTLGAKRGLASRLLACKLSGCLGVETAHSGGFSPFLAPRSPSTVCRQRANPETSWETDY